MPKYVFSNTSGYNEAVSQLKTQITSIQDDNSVQVIRDTSFFNYAINVASNDVKSQANFPLFVIASSNESRDGRDGRVIQNSTITFECYLVFMGVDKSSETMFNQFISKIVETFSSNYATEFVIENINRSNGVPPQLGGTDQYSKLWTCNLTITRNSDKY